MRKNRLKTVYASDSIQQESLPLVWKLVEYTFNNWTYLCKDVRCERSKQTVNSSQDRYKIPSCWNTLFEVNRLYAYVKQIQQADYMRKNLLLIKAQEYKIDYLPKIA